MNSEKRIGLEIRAVNNLIKRDVEKSDVFKETTSLHGWAIQWFYKNRDRDIFQRDFENHFSIRRSTASNILSLMEKNGMITRESVESDGRLKKIVLTERAIEVHKRISEDIEKRELRISNGITEEELDCFFSVISKIKANLEEGNV